MFSMAAASLATVASPSAFDRYVRDHEPVYRVDGILRAEADLFDRFDRLVGCLRAYAMRPRQGRHRQAHLVGMRGVLCGP